MQISNRPVKGRRGEGEKRKKRGKFAILLFSFSPLLKLDNEKTMGKIHD
jgi:hypothetical protein